MDEKTLLIGAIVIGAFLFMRQPPAAPPPMVYERPQGNLGSAVGNAIGQIVGGVVEVVQVATSPDSYR